MSPAETPCPDPPKASSLPPKPRRDLSFLLSDISNEKLVPLEAYMTTVLHIPEDTPPQLDAIADSTAFLQLLKQYCNKVNSDADRYPRFVALVNHTIDEMVKLGVTTNPAEFTVCLSRPKPVEGVPPEMTPSTVGVKASAIDVRISQDEKESGKDVPAAAQASPSSAFMWDELLTFFEFKMERKTIKNGIRVPKAVTKKGKVSASVVVCSSADALFQMPAGPKQQPPTPLHTSTPSKAHRRSIRLAEIPCDPSPAPVSGVKRPLEEPGDDAGTVTAKRPTKRARTYNYFQQRFLCASYALDMLNLGGIRTHVIGGLVVDDNLQLFLYTRSGICRTEPFSFVEQPRIFLRILLGLSRMTLSQWGVFEGMLTHRLSCTSVPPATPQLQPDRTLYMNKSFVLGDFQFVVGCILVFPSSLTGSGTWIIQATCLKLSWLRLVIKFSSVSAKRKPEWVFLQAAYQAAQKDQQHIMVLDHLPNLLCWDQSEFEKSFVPLFGEGFEWKEMRVMVVEELVPITRLSDPVHFTQAFRETIICHKWLVGYPGIMHRDISMNNLMFRMNINKKICGVLNDFDLACFISEMNDFQALQRAGTKPFMSIDLLCPPNIEMEPMHYARYDLEAFVYVFAAIVAHYEDGRYTSNPLYEEWFKGTWESAGTAKRVWLMEPLAEESLTANYKSLKDLLSSLRTQLRYGRNEFREALARKHRHDGQLKMLDGQPFDQTTLGGFVTYEHILAVFGDVFSYT
ncbi:hypothetical protein VNI00_011574 [Paramarasmius palmivorus]|uniref:Protein kinase domain-containing protein n=1 Tax=Paramarasmius palmivorus TaxID=297713 RepID=A0AAW0CDN3_9AGAR